MQPLNYQHYDCCYIAAVFGADGILFMATAEEEEEKVEVLVLAVVMKQSHIKARSLIVSVILAHDFDIVLALRLTITKGQVEVVSCAAAVCFVSRY